MTDWDEIEREVSERNAKLNDEAMRSPRWQQKRAILRQQIEAGLFDQAEPEEPDVDAEESDDDEA